MSKMCWFKNALAVILFSFFARDFFYLNFLKKILVGNHEVYVVIGNTSTRNSHITARSRKRHQTAIVLGGYYWFQSEPLKCCNIFVCSFFSAVSRCKAQATKWSFSTCSCVWHASFRDVPPLGWWITLSLLWTAVERRIRTLMVKREGERETSFEMIDCL